MRTDLGTEELIEQVGRIGLAVGAQTAELDPADRAMYALRDVTATVPSTTLIASSIMSKKLAGGASFILLDVKVGSGAFMADLDAARELAELCTELGRRAQRTTAALITDMSQPLGDMIGNAIEVSEAIHTLRGERQTRLLEICLRLVAHLACLSGTTPDADAGYEQARQALDNGAGLERLRCLIEAQGGNPKVIEDLDLLPRAAVAHEVHAAQDGWLAEVDTQAIGHAAAVVGAGRQSKDDVIDPAAGIELHTKIGDRVQKGSIIARVFAGEDEAAEAAADHVLKALSWSHEAVEPPPLIHDLIQAPQSD